VAAAVEIPAVDKAVPVVVCAIGAGRLTVLGRAHRHLRAAQASEIGAVRVAIAIVVEPIGASLVSVLADLHLLAPRAGMVGAVCIAVAIVVHAIAAGAVGVFCGAVRTAGGGRRAVSVEAVHPPVAVIVDLVGAVARGRLTCYGGFPGSTRGVGGRRRTL
jgi:hypothetical protein